VDTAYVPLPYMQELLNVGGYVEDWPVSPAKNLNLATITPGVIRDRTGYPG
jgi:hypothetical protein